jgi:hypothetical protein
MKEAQGRLLVEEIKYLFEQLGYEDIPVDVPLVKEEIVEPIDLVYVKRTLEEKLELPEDSLIKDDVREEKETVSTMAHAIIVEHLLKEKEKQEG